MLKHPEDSWDRKKDLEEEKTKLLDIFPELCKQLKYTYDMGDSWEHTVLFEKEVQTEEKLPKFIRGANMCPFEDSGSTFGWEEKLKIQKNPKAPYYKETRQWLGLEQGEYIDPSEFDPSEINFSDPKEKLIEWKEQLKNF